MSSISMKKKKKTRDCPTLHQSLTCSILHTFTLNAIWYTEKGESFQNRARSNYSICAPDPEGNGNFA